MGFFNNAIGESKPLSDKYKPGDLVTIAKATVVKGVKTVFGTDDMVTIVDGDGEILSLFGKQIAQQVAGIEEGELPLQARYCLTALSGKRTMKVFAEPDSPVDAKGFLKP